MSESEVKPEEIIGALLKEHRKLLEALERAKPTRLGYTTLINLQSKLLKNLLDFIKFFGVKEKRETLLSLLSRVAEEEEKKELMAVKRENIDELLGELTEVCVELVSKAARVMNLATRLRERMAE